MRQTSWPPEGEGHFPEHFAEEDRVVAGLEWQWLPKLSPKTLSLHSCFAVLLEASLMRQHRPWVLSASPAMPGALYRSFRGKEG
jgi:hypothetical protein